MGKRVAVVGAGISGLATAFRLRRLRPEWTVMVYEREPTPGGKVRTTTRDGYTVEWGPNGFLTGVPDSLELAIALGLGDALLPAADASKRRYLFRDGGLRPLPTNPPALLGTELLSVAGKMRAAMEPLLASRHTREETVFAFLERHFGREAADALAEPFVLGITGGDPHELSLDALFPRLREIEDEHRSLILGMIRAQRKKAPGPAGRLTTFADGGTQRLTDALAASLGEAVVLGATVASLEPGPRGGVRLHVERRNDPRDTGRASSGAASTLESLDFDAVVLASPAHTTAAMLRDWKPDAAELLDQIPFAPIGVLGLGFDRIDVPRVLDGFGFLAPSGKGVRSLGVLWSSTMFPGQAPDGKVLLRILAGGRRDPGFAELDEAEAVAAVMSDLARSMGVTADPEFVEHVPWPRAIPQYTLGHAGRADRVEQILGEAAESVFLTGNSYRGVGLNDCVRDANRTAATVADRLGSAGSGTNSQTGS